MLINDEKNRLSYIQNLMFRQEFLEMMNRDFSLTAPCDYEVTMISATPPIVSTEVKEVYTYHPMDMDPFQINIRNLMIEQSLSNRIQVISDIFFPKDFIWPIIENREEHLKKNLPCFTGKKPSRWNLALIDKCEKYHFTDTYYLGYREDDFKKVSEIIQTSTFDPYRITEYIVNSSKGFEENLNYCDEIKWEGKSKARYSIKKDKNDIYHIF